MARGTAPDWDDRYPAGRICRRPDCPRATARAGRSPVRRRQPRSRDDVRGGRWRIVEAAPCAAAGYGAPAMTSEPIALSQADANIFNCPICARPLATGIRMQRCPGCRTRLVLATPASRVAVFVSAGLLVGLVIASSV